MLTISAYTIAFLTLLLTGLSFRVSRLLAAFAMLTRGFAA